MTFVSGHDWHWSYSISIMHFITVFVLFEFCLSAADVSKKCSRFCVERAVMPTVGGVRLVSGDVQGKDNVTAFSFSLLILVCRFTYIQKMPCMNQSSLWLSASHQREAQWQLAFLCLLKKKKEKTLSPAHSTMLWHAAEVIICRAAAHTPQSVLVSRLTHLGTESNWNSCFCPYGVERLVVGCLLHWPYLP